MSKKIPIRNNYKVDMLDVSTVLTVKALGDYVIIKTSDARKLVTLSTMKDMRETLGKGFMRVHRSHIVNTDRIDTVSQAAVVMRGGITVPVGRVYRKELRKWYSR